MPAIWFIGNWLEIRFWAHHKWSTKELGHTPWHTTGMNMVACDFMYLQCMKLALIQ